MRASSRSPEATLFEIFLIEMGQRIADALALGRESTPLAPHTIFVDRRTGHLSRIVREQPASWFTLS